jgi:hypothetical protein
LIAFMMESCPAQRCTVAKCSPERESTDEPRMKGESTGSPDTVLLRYMDNNFKEVPAF